jgi:hypothetical protein
MATMATHTQFSFNSAEYRTALSIMLLAVIMVTKDPLSLP